MSLRAIAISTPQRPAPKRQDLIQAWCNPCCAKWNLPRARVQFKREVENFVSVVFVFNRALDPHPGKHAGENFAHSAWREDHKVVLSFPLTFPYTWGIQPRITEGVQHIAFCPTTKLGVFRANRLIQQHLYIESCRMRWLCCTQRNNRSDAIPVSEFWGNTNDRSSFDHFRRIEFLREVANKNLSKTWLEM